MVRCVVGRVVEDPNTRGSMNDENLIPLDTERARVLGKRSGKARKRLTLADVEDALGPLETEQDAKRRLGLLGVWLTAGLVSGSQGGAAVRSVEVWLKAHAEQVDRDRLREAEKKVRELERELRSTRGLRVAQGVA